ncbi:hypothetical protein PIB30_076142 [Stylosanthes scabra]|uniref:Uncharacterized protein n=1 Tax=Stylosanthes scabra TaxID=79078 RepID=A0ABU6URA1_9FABA|nr:hypothetical protein [Stylosanthes scabra]
MARRTSRVSIELGVQSRFFLFGIDSEGASSSLESGEACVCRYGLVSPVGHVIRSICSGEIERLKV